MASGPPRVTLEQYAEIRAALRGLGPNSARAALGGFGLDPVAWERAEAYWTDALERDSTGGDGELLLRWAEASKAAAAARSTPKQAPAAPPAPEPKTPDVAPPRASAPSLPSFMLNRAPAPIASPMAPAPRSSPATLVSAPSLDRAPVDRAPPPRVPVHAPPPRFAAPPDPGPPPAPASARFEVEETSFAADAPPSAPLPFRASPPASPPSAPRPSAPATSPTRPSATAAHDPFNMTIAGGGPSGPSTPFEHRATGAPASARRAEAPAAPASSRAAPAPGTGTIPLAPSLTLETYAELSAELAAFPADAPAIRARFGMSNDGVWAAAQAKWQLRIQMDASLHARWTAAYTDHLAHLKAR